jgi:mannosyltransferase
MSVALYVMLGVAFVLRIVNITGESLWRDEVDTIRFAFMPIEQLVANIARTGFNGPLYTFLVRGWLSLTGINDFTLRYFSLFFGVVQIVLIYVFARRLSGRWAALVAMWLAILAPVLIWYSGEGKMYTLQPTLLLLALYALRRAVESDPAVNSSASDGLVRRVFVHLNAWWIVFVVSVSFAYYVHLLSPLFIIVAIVFICMWWPLAKRHIVGALISLALCTLPYIPLAIWQMPVLIKGMVTGHEQVALDVLFNNLLTNWSIGLTQQLSAILNLLAVLAFVIAACLGLWAASEQTVTTHISQDIANRKVGVSALRFRSAMGVLAWLVLPPLLVFVISLRAPVFEPRYLLWCAPALYVLCGVGVVWLMKRMQVVGITLFILLTLCCTLGYVYQIVYPIRPDVRAAAKFIAKEISPDDLVFFQIPYTRYGFLYYLPRFVDGLPIDGQPQRGDGLISIQGLREHFLDAPYTNNQSTPDDVIAYLTPLVGDTRRVWYVEAESTMWDARGMGRAWFESNMLDIEQFNFRDIRVTRYEKP